MRAMPLKLIDGCYADETRPWSQQDICNWLPCASEQEGTRTPTMAKTPPGLSPFVDTGAVDPVRGVYTAEGRLFTVAGSTAYQISNTGVAIPLGAIPGVGRVRCAHNQITGGNEVLFVNGSAGWVWNTVTSVLTQITDTGYPGAIDAVFIDGYLIQIEPARRYAFHSDLADATTYNTLDRFTSEVSPDLLVALAVSNNELILFSERTTEFFYNSGAAQQPFRSKRISFNKGCAGRYTVGTMDNTVFWLGDDGAFYLLDGYTPKRISTRPIEQAIRGLNWAQAFAFVWEDSGHSVCYWTFPDGLTFGYDASQQKWHRRASYGFDRWRVQDLAYWQDRWIAGDFQTGKLWELDWAYPWEGDQAFISELTGPVIHDNQSLLLLPRLELVMDTGMSEVEIRGFLPQPEGPTISGNAPAGWISEAYSYAYTVTAGDAAIVGVSLLSGALPAGLSLSSAGVLSGTPTTAGTATFTVRVIDANGLFQDLADSVAVTTVIASVTDSHAAASTTLSVTMPATVATNAMLIATVAINSNAVIPAPTGWTEAYSNQALGRRISTFYKLAVGTEGGTPITSTLAFASAHASRVVVVAPGAFTGVPSGGGTPQSGTTNPAPPPLTVAAATPNYFTIASFAVGTTTATATVYPYSSNQASIKDGTDVLLGTCLAQGAAPQFISGAWRIAPGTFTASASVDCNSGTTILARV